MALSKSPIFQHDYLRGSKVSGNISKGNSNALVRGSIIRALTSIALVLV